MKIIIADDHELIRNGIKTKLTEQKDLEVIGEASDGAAAFDLIIQQKPEVAILDISMPEMTGIDVLAKINEEAIDTKVIILTMHDDYQYVDKCLELGAKGYVAKGDAGSEILNAIAWVNESKIFFSSSIQEVVLHNFAKTSAQKDAPEGDINVTKREKEVLKMVAEGLTSSQIAESLFVSPRTVDTHRANLMRKMEVKNAVELVIKARKMSLID